MKSIEKQCSIYLTKMDLSVNKHFELLLPLIIKGKKYNLLTIDAMDAYQFEGDLFSLLAKHNIPAFYHWITMRLNDFYSPTEFNESHRLLLIPDMNYLHRFYKTHQFSDKT